MLLTPVDYLTAVFNVNAIGLTVSVLLDALTLKVVDGSLLL